MNFKKTNFIFFIFLLLYNCNNSGDSKSLSSSLLVPALIKDSEDNSSKTDTEIKNPLDVDKFFLQGRFIKTKDGRFFAFGINLFGELGVGDTKGRTLPTEIPLLKGKVKDIPYNNNCYGNLIFARNFAVTEDNGLWAWGNNRTGQLGLGDTNNRTSPTEVTSLRGKVKKAYICYGNSFVITTDNRLFAWGNNRTGQLGLGDTNDRTSPTEITSLKGIVKDIHSYNYFRTEDKSSTFVVTTDNRLFAWGYNNNGQLGFGDTNDRTLPIEITSLKGIVKEFFPRDGDSVFFVSTTDNKLYAWGKNETGQLGLGDTNDRTSPTEITSLSGESIKSLYTVNSYTYLTTDSGKVFAFGNNQNRQLGLGDKRDRNLPTEVTLLKNKVKDIFVNPYSVLTHTTDDSLIFIGNDRSVPTETTLLKNKVKKLYLGGQGRYFVVTKDNKFYAWGRNLAGELGLGDKTNRNSPTEVPLFNDRVKEVFGQSIDSTTFLVTTDNKLFASGSNARGIGIDINETTSFTQVIIPTEK